MTAVRTKVAVLAGLGALACTGATLVAGPATAATPAPTAEQTTCDRAPWQARVQGEPKNFKPGSMSGDYLWHDANGFHLRVTHAGPQDRRGYSGTITSNEPMRLEPVKLEGRDTVGLSANRKVITFHFDNYGGIDGINFHTDCARSLTLSNLTVGGHALPTDHVVLGYYHEHPAKVPFTVHRYGGPS